MLTVTADLDLVLVLGGDRAVEVPTTLHYDTSAPYAVNATFRTSDGDVTWVFGRDLLAEGLDSPSGEGDVAVWPSNLYGRAVVCVSLQSPTGSALLEGDAVQVRAFLEDTVRLVPFGTEGEQIDLDAELAALLGDDASPLR
jgi:Streptomyces sporulation and cell division protein, SsgA